MVLRKFSGVAVRRVIDRGGAEVPEHAHDWPVLSLFVMGGYLNRTEHGQTFIGRPSAVLYRAGAAHRNSVASVGFEQIEIEFDPAWLGPSALPDIPVSRWLGGRAGADVRALANTCVHETAEERLRPALFRFIEKAQREPEGTSPAWLAMIARRLRDNTTVKVTELARDVGLHPSWLGTAYKLATGEGLPETAARFRLERAAFLLRETDHSAASIAAEAGFCDQSHMHRTFKRMFGRSPSAVREDRRYFRQNLALPSS